VLCIVTRAVDDSTLVAAAKVLRDTDVLWLSHPRDWSPVLTDVAWVPAGSDSRGRAAVVVDSVGVVRADAFLRAISQGDRRFSSATIRRVMAERVQRLRASHEPG
jgi:hypothetical protein